MLKRTGYINKIKPYINNKIIKVLIGMKRTGKSTLLLLIQEELKNLGVEAKQIISINLELLKNRHYTNYNNLIEYIESQIVNKNKYYIFLDEIQEVTNFEVAINCLVNEYNIDLYITSSNANILSKEFTGRYITFEIMPLSFKEMYEGKNIDNNFINYIKYGSLPSIYNQEEKLSLICDLWYSIIYDIVKRYNIRDHDLFERFIQFLLANIGQIFSSSEVINYLECENKKPSKETIYNYLHYCENAFLIHRIPRYNIKGKESLKTLEKYYINDLGFRTLFFNNETDINQVLENIVCLELIRRNYKLRIGIIKDQEIDFKAIKKDLTIYIQVCYLLADETVINREFNPLLNIKDSYPKYVISMDRLNMSRKGINHLNVIDFLITEKI